MKRACLVMTVCFGLVGCADPGGEETGPGGGRPVPRPASLAPAPPATASTAEEYDTTTTAERQAAQYGASASSAERVLGHTIATLGNPATPGFWLETPLVARAGKGRVVAVATGKSVIVDLIPIDGAAGAGSRISLAALRLLDVGLTGLHELQVFMR